MNTSNKVALAKEYFNFRLLQEQELYTIKKKQNVIKRYLLNDLKSCEGIYVKRINNAITIYKKIPTKTSITVFDFVINGLERSFKRHYNEHKEQILKYINGIFKLYDELKEFRKTKKKAFKKFKKSFDNTDLTMYNLAYIQFQNKLKAFKFLKISYVEFEKLMNDYKFMKDIIDEYMFEFSKDIDSKIENKQEEIYLEEIKSLFNLDDDKKSLMEKEVLAILTEMNIVEKLEVNLQ